MRVNIGEICGNRLQICAISLEMKRPAKALATPDGSKQSLIEKGSNYA